MFRNIGCTSPNNTIRTELIGTEHLCLFGFRHPNCVGRKEETDRRLVGCFRYKALAQQYKAMYPTLEIDIDGELVKLKVTEVTQKVLSETLSPPLCSNISSADFRTMWSGSSPWWETGCTSCTRLFMVLRRRFWWKEPTQPCWTSTLVSVWLSVCMSMRLHHI